MKQFSYVITDELGIHARPAGLMVKAASVYKSSVTVAKGDKSADAKRIFGIMGLGVKQHDEITVTIEGEDENEAAQGLEEFIKNNL